MNRRKPWTLLVLLAVVGAAMSLAIACSDDGDDDGGDGGDATATEVMSSTPHEDDGETPDGHDDPAVLHIELSEWSITGEDGSPIPSAPAGDVTFETHNDGTTAHALVVIKTDIDPAALPLDGTTVDEDAAGEVIGEVAEFAAGDIEIGTFELEAGNYALICNVAAHYEQGMHAALVVE